MASTRPSTPATSEGEPSHARSGLWQLVAGGSLTTISTIAGIFTIVSFVAQQPWVGAILASITGVSFLALMAWAGFKFVPKLWRLGASLVSLAKAVDEGRITKIYSEQHDEDSDAERLVVVGEDLLDICVAIEASLAKAAENVAFEPPRAVLAQLLEDVLTLTARLFREFSGREATVLLQGRDPRIENQIVNLAWMRGVPHRRKVSHCSPYKLGGTVVGKVLDEGKGHIKPTIDALEVDADWNNREEYIESLIAWPITIDGNVQAVLKIDSPSANAFRDTAACRLLARLCAHKVSEVVQIYHYIQRATDVTLKQQEKSFVAPITELEGLTEEKEGDGEKQ